MTVVDWSVFQPAAYAFLKVPGTVRFDEEVLACVECLFVVQAAGCSGIQFCGMSWRKPIVRIGRDCFLWRCRSLGAVSWRKTPSIQRSNGFADRILLSMGTW